MYIGEKAVTLYTVQNMDAYYAYWHLAISSSNNFSSYGVSNAKIQPYLQNFCTASHCKIIANHFSHLQCSRVKTFRDLQKSRSIRQEAARCFARNALRISEKFNIRSLLYFRLLGKHKIPVARNLKTISKKLKQKIKKKIVSFKNSFIFRVSGFCTNAVNGV